MSKITVIRIKPRRKPEVVEIENTLKSLQTEVEGYIEVLYPWEDPVAIIRDEEGKLKGKALNRGLRDENGNFYDIIAGTFLIAGLSEDDFDDIGEYKNKYIEKFQIIEFW